MSKPLVPDDLWRRVEPLLPKRRRSRHRQFAGRKTVDDRKAFEGIVFALKTGVPWALLPATSQWPSGVTCWRRLMKWHRAGVWRRLLESLLAEMQAQGLLDWERALVDSAHLRAPGGGRKTGPSPVDRRKRGSKHHVLTDAEGTPLVLELTAANRNDITQLLKLVEAIPPVRGKRGRPRRRPKRLQGDRGYDSQAHRRELKKRRSSR
jgi:transposase